MLALKIKNLMESYFLVSYIIFIVISHTLVIKDESGRKLKVDAIYWSS